MTSSHINCPFKYIWMDLARCFQESWPGAFTLLIFGPRQINIRRIQDKFPLKKLVIDDWLVDPFEGDSVIESMTWLLGHVHALSWAITTLMWPAATACLLGISVSEDMLELTQSMHNQDPLDGIQFSRETGIEVADKFERTSQTSVLKLGNHNTT